MNKLFTVLFLFVFVAINAEIAMAGKGPLKNPPQFSKRIGSNGFAEGLKPKNFDGKPTAAYFVPESHYVVTSPMTCDQLMDEWVENAGLNSIDALMKPGQLFYTFFMDCRELATAERAVSMAGFLISYGEPGDQILNGEYAAKQHSFYGKKIKFIKPEQTMAYVSIEHDGAEGEDVEHWILMNIPFREFGNLLTKLVTLIDIGGAVERKAAMTKFLTSHLPDLDPEVLSKQLRPDLEEVDFMLYPIFQGEGEIFNYYLFGMGDEFDCPRTCY